MIRKRRGKSTSSGPKFSLPHIGISDEIKKDMTGIFLFILAFISILSFVNLAGELGEKINGVIRLLFGWGFVLFPAVTIFWGWKIVKAEDEVKNRSALFGASVMVLSLLSLAHVIYSPTTVEMFDIAKKGDGGGIFGASVAWVLVSLIEKNGAVIVILGLFIISILLTFDVSFLSLIQGLKFKKSSGKEEQVKKEKTIEEIRKEGEEEVDVKINIAGQAVKPKEKGIIPTLAAKTAKEEKQPEFSVKQIEEAKDDSGSVLDEEIDTEGGEEVQGKLAVEEKHAPVPKHKKINWKIPPLGLLDGVDGEPTSGDIKANSNIIKRTLANFGIPVEMGEVNVGPTVTQYTLKPAVGVKLSRITSLQSDLALALAARSLRIEAPIPGKSWVGIELPNQTVAMVRLRNILESVEFKNRKTNLSVVLGRDVSGSPIFANLAKMPHMLIAGATGSGKTVCINTLITGLLFQNTPDNLRFIMIDPKRVELTAYNDIPHLLTSVITDPDKAINSLKWCVTEMENRYELLSHLGCRNIESYNHAVATKYTQREILPYIIVVIDELADLMATHGREMEAVIVRLAQMARAVGIHLVLSTQRPSVEVITGLIKANITTRIAFQVASQIDSRTILDMSGADKLLGSGDMLYLSNESNKPRRIQGVFISEEEVREVADYLKTQKGEENVYNDEITETKKSSVDAVSIEGDEIIDDDMYDEAVAVVKESGKASASLLQRRLRVGYARAARLLDLMEEQGIVGPANGAKPREVYVGNGSDNESVEAASGVTEIEEESA